MMLPQTVAIDSNHSSPSFFDHKSPETAHKRKMTSEEKSKKMERAERKLRQIDISALNTPPEENELKVAKFFSEKGKNISFIRPSSIPGQRRPDIEMDGIEWEIKCPIGKSKRTIQNNIMSAEGQSAYIIIDLRYIKLPEKECLSQIKLHFLTRSRVKRILVITKNLELVEFPSKNN